MLDAVQTYAESLPFSMLVSGFGKQPKELAWIFCSTEEIGLGLICDLLGAFAPLTRFVCSPEQAELPVTLPCVTKWQK